MDGDDEVVGEVATVRADFFCFVLARTMATPLDHWQIRRLFVSKAVGKHHSGPGYAIQLLDVPLYLNLIMLLASQFMIRNDFPRYDIVEQIPTYSRLAHNVYGSSVYFS